jgi:RNA polymerase sigma factor (sigma-70 family)
MKKVSTTVTQGPGQGRIKRQLVRVELLPAHSVRTPLEELTARELTEKGTNLIRTAMEKLGKVEKKVLKFLYFERMTIKKCAKRFHVSVEKIQEVCNKALQKLRAFAEVKQLAELW